MKKYMSIEEVRKIQKELLKYLNERCEQLNIPCFLGGGTLIGAIRHQGYIPWDDDIDVLMFSEDYQKLVASLKKDINANYELLDCTLKPGYTNIIAKFCDKRTGVEEMDEEVEWGIFIDIFLLDGMGNTLEDAVKHMKKAKRYQSYFFFALPNKKLNKSHLLVWPVFLLCRLIGRNYFYHKLLKLSKKYSAKDSRYIAALISGVQGVREINPNYVFSDTIKVPFEELTCLAPRGYDVYLTNLYNNYMKLPPIEKRKAPHEIKAWWK